MVELQQISFFGKLNICLEALPMHFSHLLQENKDLLQAFSTPTALQKKNGHDSGN